jgi:hypothetical protein
LPILKNKDLPSILPDAMPFALAKSRIKIRPHLLSQKTEPCKMFHTSKRFGKNCSSKWQMKM